MKKKRIGMPVLWLVYVFLVCILAANIAIKTSVITSAAVAPVQPDIRGMYGRYIDDVAEQYHICPELLEAMIERESNGQADAVSAGGDVGLLQINPKWHRERMDRLGVTDLKEPYSNIVAAADYLAELFEQYEDLPMVLMRPKEVFADAVATSHTSILIGDLAKLLKQNGVDIGQKRLFSWMRENGYLIKRQGSDWNMPTQRSMELGLFEVKESATNNPDGSVRINRTTKVTGKGQQYFINKFLGEVA